MLFVIWMGSVFLGGETEESSRGRGTTGSSQSPLPPSDWRQRRPLEYLLLSFVFCSFFSSSRCWEVLYLFICLLSRSSVFSSISPFTWSTISSIYEPDKEGGERQRDREKEKEKGEGDFFYPLLFSFFSPLHSSSLSSPSLSLPAFSIPVQPTLPAPPPPSTPLTQYIYMHLEKSHWFTKTVF